MTLPADLERLGRQLELAAGGAVRRRVRRRRTLALLAALAATAPLALTVAGGGGGDLPAASPPAVAADRGASFAVYSQEPADNVAVRQARARPAPDPPELACLDSNDCGRAAPPMRLMTYPDPARRA